MIRSSVTTALRARRVVAACAIAVLAVGVVQLRHAEVDSLPEFGPPIVEVDTEALGLSAPEVEQLITVPLEQDLLDGVAWLAQIHSVSLPGLSHVTMVFEPGTDLLRARQVVQERISQAAGLPNVSSLPQMIQPESSTSRVMMVGLSSDRISPIDMSVLARWTIRPRLLGVPGVASVSIWGQRERQLQVQVDPKRLEDAGIRLQQVIETAGNALWASPLTFLEANTPGTGGFVDTNNQRLGVQHLQPITTAADLARVPIEDIGGATVRLSDVATVVEDHQPLIGDAVLTGGAGLLLVIEKFPGANTVDVTRGVEDALDALRPGLEGIEIDPTVYRPADYIQSSVHNVGVSVIGGLFLAFVALAALIGGWRRGLIALIAVAVSLAVAGLALDLLGATFNTMVVAGLVMGLAVVIDDAVTDVHGIRARRGEPLDGQRSVVAAIVRGAGEIRSSAVYATAVTVVSVLPLFALRGSSGAFLPPLVRSYLVAIAASMVVALMITPALAALLLRRTELERSDARVARSIRERCGRLISALVRAPGIAATVVVVVLVMGVAAVPFLRRASLPPIDDADVFVDWSAPPGTSLTEMDRITTRVTQELGSIRGVSNVAAHVGRAVTSDQAVGVDQGEIWISIARDADHSAVLASIERVTGGYPGMRADVLTYPNQRITNVLSDAARPITVRVFGQSPVIVAEKATEIRNAIAGVDGVVDPRVQVQPVQPSIDVKVDLARARDVGIKPGDVRRAAATVMSGIAVGSLFEEQKVFDVVVWGTPSTRSSLSAVRNLLIDTPDGGHVRLADVADVDILPTPTVIRHEDISRYVDVTAAVDGRDVGDVVAEVKERVAAIDYPLEYHARVIRNDGEAIESAHRVLAIAVAGIVVLFLLLQAAFRSWRLAVIAFVLLAASLSGGAVAVASTGRTVTVGSIAGFFLVLGLASRWLIVSGRHIQSLVTDDGVPFGADLVQHGAEERIVPITNSVVATGLALLPFAVSTGVAGQEVVHPMAIVVLGGLVTSLIAAGFVLPALAARFGATPQPDLFELALLALDDETIVNVPDLEPVSAGAGGSRSIDEPARDGLVMDPTARPADGSRRKEGDR